MQQLNCCQIALGQQMKIVVVPHLPCLNNELGLCTGLSSQGASEFGKSLSHYVKVPESKYGRINAILSSPLPRCIETVELCFSSYRCPVLYDVRLLALDYGDYHDKSIAYVSREQHRFLTTPYPGGESYADMAARYASFLDEALPQFVNKTVILIGHNGTKEMLAHLCLGLSLESLFNMRKVRDRKPTRVQIEAQFARAEYVCFEYS